MSQILDSEDAQPWLKQKHDWHEGSVSRTLTSATVCAEFVYFSLYHAGFLRVLPFPVQPKDMLSLTDVS